jgi:hypothetical protein
MPKKIIKNKISGCEKASRILAVIAMLATFAFGTALVFLIKNLSGNDVSRLLGCLTFAGYVLFFGLTAAHCIQGIYVFHKQEHYSILFQAILTGFAAFSALVNVQFALAMLFSAVGKDSLAEKVIGDTSFDDFMSTQHSSWTLLTFGIGVVICVGIAGAVKLIRNASK